MSFSSSDWNPRRIFLIALTLTLIFRLWLAVILPITGDEAYFIWWGQWPAWGYHDHPPMIGWWHAAFLMVSHAEWWLRLTTVLLPTAVALMVAAYLKAHGERIAWGTATLILLAPANVWNVIVTTDTPLVFFSVGSALAWLRARRAEDEGSYPWRWYLLSGFMLAGAVLSKYFVALLGFAYLVDTLIKPSRRKFGGLLLVYALTVPGIALMAWWNAGNCWPNVMFNFYNRHNVANTGFNWHSPPLYVAMMAYLLTPICLWYLAKTRRVVIDKLRSGEIRAIALIAFVPLSAFAGLSFLHNVGLHWGLSFVPFALILLALCVDAARMKTALRFFAGFAALHVVVFVALAYLPLDLWKNTKIYPGLVLTVKADQLLDKLQAYDDYTWMMDGYSNAVTLGFNTYARDPAGNPRYIGVFGIASGHARHDDILTDVRALDGGKIAVLRKTPPDLDADYRPYFKRVRLETFEISGVPFYLVLGDGFDYAAYRDTILAQVKELYYGVPAALPQTACYFCDRYFPGQPCQR